MLRDSHNACTHPGRDSRVATRRRPATRSVAAIRATPARRRPLHGFTLMEVLVALAVFTVGIIGVAAVFPVAILLQKETIYSVESKQFGRNAEALVSSLGFTAAMPAQWDPMKNDGLGPNPDTVRPMPASALANWSIEDRSYNVIAPWADRRVFWVPLVYDTNADPADESWRVYLFVVRSRSDGDYTKFPVPQPPTGPSPDIQEWANPLDSAAAPGIPGVARINVDASGGPNSNGKYEMAFDNNPRIVFAGDQIVDVYGTIYSVAEATDTAIYVDGSISGTPPSLDVWAAHPGDQTTTSAVKIIMLLETETLTLIDP